MKVRGLFVSGSGRVRAGWRIGLFVLLFALFGALLTGLLSAPMKAVDAWFGIADAGNELLLTLAALLAHVVMLKVDRQGWAYVRLDRGAAHRPTVAVGFATGIVPITVASLVLVAVGWLSFQASPAGSWFGAAFKVTILLLAAALFEELVSRGYIFQALADGVTTPGAVAITSTAFGILHLGNPGVSPLAILSVILAGIFLAAVLIVTKSLFAAWAAHFAWNWVMAVPLHVAVSGTTIPTPGYRLVDSGPDWASGGDWGPEGGAFACVAMVAVMWWMYRRSAVTTADSSLRSE